MVTTAETLALEARAKENGFTAELLLNMAGTQLGHAISRFFTHPGTVIGYLGKGHNAADTLIALGILREHYGWQICIRPAYPLESCAPLTQEHWHRLAAEEILEPVDAIDFPRFPLLLLDGLLGTGTNGPLRPPLLELAREMNALRQHSGARTAAVDLPSGIEADTGKAAADTVRADVTFMIANAKLGLLQAHAAAMTGALAIVRVAPLTAPLSPDQELISPQTLACGKSPRPIDFHKGQAGRVAIMAGSESYTGAAVLAASGALRAGAGLVTLFVPPAIKSVLSSICPPEIILRAVEDPRDLLKQRFDAIVVGCGLGTMNQEIQNGLLELISKTSVPTVIDAEALNLIASRGALALITDKHILTPHPGELARLAPALASLPRELAIRQFADMVPATLLLKGSRTLVTHHGEPLWCNSTGTPGMATGGQGDLLSGVIGALLAAGESPIHAASLGAWICGRSAEIAIQERYLSEESLTPSDVLHFIGTAFKDWKCGLR